MDRFEVHVFGTEAADLNVFVWKDDCSVSFYNRKQDTFDAGLHAS